MKEEDINKAGDNEQLELTNEISLTEEIPPTDDNSRKKDSSEEHSPSLTEVLKERATEDEAPLSRTFSLKKILGGDILYTSFIRRQVWLFLLIAMFMVVYIANRYSCQQDIIEIDKLQDELLDAKYKALSSNSQLTEKSRQSNILDMLKNNKDSTLKLPTQPPYIITVPE